MGLKTPAARSPSHDRSCRSPCCWPGACSSASPWAAGWLRRPPGSGRSTGLADAVITAAEGSGEDGFILVELIHGAAHRIPDESAAFRGRRAVANVTALSIWREAGGDEAGIEWGRRAARLFEPYSKSGAGYLNYPEVDQTVARVAAAFGPERFAKLRKIKRTWDPDNRFRHNANIVPA